jgi:adenylosuccinate lyase
MLAKKSAKDVIKDQSIGRIGRGDDLGSVQRNAKSCQRGAANVFLSLYEWAEDVDKALSGAALEDLFDLGYHLKNVDIIVKCVFDEAERRFPC